MPAFNSVADVIERFRQHSYVCDERIATTVFLADRMEKPLLVEGPAGVGKTELAKVLASVTDCSLIRLQCYEGLDEAKALYEWAYPKQLLYTQILREKVGELIAGAPTLAEAVERLTAHEDAFFSERFLLARPLLRAIRSPQRAVLLIDEIDRAEAEFEAFLLEVLSDFQISVPELGTIRAQKIPLVILTSNNTREMSDALRRRCLHLHLDYPSAERELEIVRLKIPAIEERLAQEVVQVVHKLRELDLKKKPAVSETLDWLQALVLLGAKALDEKLVATTLSLILKYQGDVERAHEKMHDLMPAR